MAKYKIECEQCLGISHFGAVTTGGESTVELSDEEVATLVKLIQEKNTTDVNELGIASSHPDLYAKLDKAYRDMACHEEYMYWLRNGYENGCYEYDEEELMDYCERECGFSFECDEDDDLDEDELYDAKSEAFCEWLDDYVDSLNDDDLIKFMREHMDAEVEVDDVEYTVKIPEEIIRKAKELK